MKELYLNAFSNKENEVPSDFHSEPPHLLKSVMLEDETCGNSRCITKQVRRRHPKHATKKSTEKSVALADRYDNFLETAESLPHIGFVDQLLCDDDPCEEVLSAMMGAGCVDATVASAPFICYRKISPALDLNTRQAKKAETKAYEARRPPPPVVESEGRDDSDEAIRASPLPTTERDDGDDEATAFSQASTVLARGGTRSKAWIIEAFEENQQQDSRGKLWFKIHEDKPNSVQRSYCISAAAVLGHIRYLIDSVGEDRIVFRVNVRYEGRRMVAHFDDIDGVLRTIIRDYKVKKTRARFTGSKSKSQPNLLASRSDTRGDQSGDKRNTTRQGFCKRSLRLRWLHRIRRSFGKGSNMFEI